MDVTMDRMSPVDKRSGPVPRLRARSSRFEDAASIVLLIAVAGYFLSFVSRYITMFPLIEYRQWVFDSRPSSLFNWSTWLHVPEIMASSRLFSLWVAQLFGDVCGPLPTCQNSLHLALLAIAAVLTALTLRRLSSSGSWFSSVASLAFILLSVPVLDAMTWQATLLDKLSMLLTAMALCMAAIIRVQNVGKVYIVVVNTIFLMLVALAYNAKEASFFLSPAVTLLVLFRLMNDGTLFWSGVRRTVILTCAPVLYASIHVAMVFYDRVFLHAGEFQRVTGGNIAFNIEYYARYMLDQFGGTVTPFDLEILVGCLGVLVVLGATAGLTAKGGRRIPYEVWAALGFVGSVIIPLRTSSTSPFYLLVPMVYLSLLLGLSVDSILARLAGPLRVCGVVACVAALAVRIVTLQPAIPTFDHLEQLSTNFQRTLVQLRGDQLQRPFNQLVFVRPPGEVRAYMYVSAPGDGDDHALATYLGPADSSHADLRAFDLKIRDIPASDLAKARQPGNVLVFLGPSLTIDHIETMPD